MSDEDLVCFCMSVTRGEIIAAVRAGHNDIPKLKREVSCCTGCGTCEERVKKILREMASAPGDANSADPAKKTEAA